MKEDLVGFIFEFNRGIKYFFIVEIFLGLEFVIGWGGKKNRKMRFKIEEIRFKVVDIFSFNMINKYCGFILI